MSQYAKDMKHILASLNDPQEESPNNTSPLPDGNEGNVIHIYPTTDGDILLSHRDYEAADVIDSQNPTPAPEPAKAPPLFLVFCFLMLLFVLLDIADNQLISLMTPNVTIALTPSVKTISLQSTAALGKELSPLTLSQSMTVAATGHGHQDAKAATGTLTFYNGLFTSQFVAAGTVFTGSDGIQVTTDQSVTIPANAPPVDGQASVTAHALNPGANGNISAGDITITINNGLLLKNAQFTNGQDARDFSIVTKSNIATAAQTLKAKVASSMTAALNGQLMPGQELQPTPCNPTVSASNAPGDEADTLQVTVSQTCSAIAYDANVLQVRATQLLTTQATNKLGQGYTLYGNPAVTVTKATTTNKTVVLTFTCQETWMYQINEARIQALVIGKPRLEALQLLTHFPGIERASISGIADNQELPTDPEHLRFLLIYASF